jgi:lambda family phage portal protein
MKISTMLVPVQRALAPIGRAYSYLAKGPRARRFDAGLVSRMTEDWFTSIASIDADLRAGLVRIRARCRDLVQNNDYAKAARREFVNNVVGTGIKIKAQVTQKRGSKSGSLDSKTNTAIERAWKSWGRRENCHAAGSLNFQDIERMIVSSLFTDGEILIRKVPQAFGKSKVPFALEIIEADLLDETLNTTAQNGNQIRMGVEKNEWGRPVAYHFWPRHPGDLGVGWLDENPRARRRIPAEEIEHLFIAERPLQSRGVPFLASTCIRLHHMAGYEGAEVVSARATASLMGFIETPNAELQGDDVNKGSAQRVTNFEPGVFKYLAQGEKVVVPDTKRPAGQFAPFMRTMLQAMAAGIGQAYEKISGDYSAGSYSSARQSLLNERDNWRVLQSWLLQHFHQPIFEEWLSLAVLFGELTLPGYFDNAESYMYPRWMPRGWSWVDPQKEVVAYNMAVRSGFMTQAEVVAQGGGDYDELVAHREREVERNEAAGLVFDSNPAQVNSKGILQPGAEDPSETDPAPGAPAGDGSDDDEDPEEDPENKN